MATIVQYQDRPDIRVGATAPTLEAIVTEADSMTKRSLVGFAAEISFWYSDATEPHLIRAAKIVDGLNGKVRYVLEGDEFFKEGHVLYQFAIYSTEWGGTSSGRGFFRACSPIQRRRVVVNL